MDVEATFVRAVEIGGRVQGDPREQANTVNNLAIFRQRMRGACRDCLNHPSVGVPSEPRCCTKVTTAHVSSSKIYFLFGDKCLYFLRKFSLFDYTRVCRVRGRDVGRDLGKRACTISIDTTSNRKGSTWTGRSDH